MRKGELREKILVVLLIVTFTLAVTSLLKSAGVLPKSLNNEDLPKTVTIQSEPSPPSDAKIVEDVEPAPEYYCLALNIYHESRSDNFVGRVAVADVVLNRVAHQRFPDNICDVVKQSVYIENWKGNYVPKRNMCQFSWYCDGKTDKPMEIEAWIQAFEMAKMILDQGLYVGLTEGATHYHTVSIRPDWTRDRGMIYQGTIGLHEFYRWE